MNGNVSPRNTQAGNTASGVLVGLMIGVLIAAAVALYINFGPKPFLAPKGDSGKATQSNPAAPTASAPVALPGKPGDKPVEKPKYDFFKILPGGEAASAPAVAAMPEKASEKLFLQAGAYQNPSDADNLKARLALIGVEANVQRVDLAEKGVFFRVRLGPYEADADADAVRAKLATEGIESSIVRSKPQTAQANAKTPSQSPPKN